MKLEVIVVCLFGGGASGAKILTLFPFPFYSHTHAFIPVFRELSARGHHLTFLSPYPQIPAPHNWTNIPMDIGKSTDEGGFLAKHLMNANKYEVIYFLWSSCLVYTEKAFNNKEFKMILDQGALDYDLIITEPFICHEPLVALGNKHNIPVVGVYPVTLCSWIAYFTGDSFLPSYIPGYYSSFSDKMTFFERLENTLLAFFKIALGLYFYLPKQELLMEKYIYQGSENHPLLYEMLKNISMHLIDADYPLSYARPFQPHNIPVGGLTMATLDPLTKDLKDFMDNSPNGFVYLNFGSQVRVSSLNTSTVDAILKAFRNIDLNFLMKWENDTLSNKPANVKIENWFPQPSILAHPKCRLFITHGGIHGISEAAYNGVPVIGVPFFSDQMFNVRYAVEAGFSYQVLKDEITAENFQFAIETVLKNKTYKEKAMRRSEGMRDRASSALDKAVYWIEYALRHKDLSHLRPASTDLPLYQLFLLDVFFFILICLILVLAALFYSLRMAMRLTNRLTTRSGISMKKSE